jgi:tRNA-binding EMAP/Myf-like protein
MKLPIGWLRDYLDVTSSSDEIAERLAGLGFPVESIERRPALSGVVVGRLRAVEKHPNADRLQVCTVDIDGAETLTIATAATNVAAGQVVPVALLGAVLAGMTIGPRKMRGIDSEGMLVSKRTRRSAPMRSRATASTATCSMWRSRPIVSTPCRYWAWHANSVRHSAYRYANPRRRSRTSSRRVRPMRASRSRVRIASVSSRNGSPV